MKDSFDVFLTKIIARIQKSSLSDDKKADIYAEITLGLHKLTWSMVLSYIPEDQMKLLLQKKIFNLEEYSDLISSILEKSEVPVKIHEEIMAALTDIDRILSKNGI